MTLLQISETFKAPFGGLGAVVLIPVLPFLCFLLLGLFGKKHFAKSGGIIGTLSLAASAVLSLWTAYNYFFVSGKVNGVYRKIEALKITWLEFAPGVSIDMGLLLDPISVMMLVVVTFVSLMVHVYSLGYMKGEERFPVYYSFLSLFTFSMLGLVLSSNIFQIYIFWELVGVSSFLLIGYYFEKPSAVAASKKAFIVTRFADLGFLIGILILSFHAETLDFGTLIQRLTDSNSTPLHTAAASSFIGLSALTWGLLLVFMGGAGKSAMFPLHIWLPDAMEGPTPVSALIHAATMVVAGVYLVARLFPVFAISCPGALEVVMYVGAFSALFAAVVACTQTDIKRVLAYSTMSQIGYMMFALGVSGYGGESGLGFTASMFHLFTHAMFKALLFLGAGAVIHYVHSNEMGDMGGLRKYMPVTHLTFLIACLAIAGVPPLSGFFSKEEILTAAFHSNKLIYGIALFTAGLTAFYMFRLYFSIFWKKEYNNHKNDLNHKGHIEHKEAAVSPHSEGKGHGGEAPMTMKLPLMILGLLAVVAGFVPFGNFVSSDGKALHSEFHLTMAIAPIVFGLIGIALAFVMYKRENNLPAKISGALRGLYQSALHKFYVDEVYLFVTKKIVFNLIGRPSAWIDKNAVNGLVDAGGMFAQDSSEEIRVWQSGKVQSYAIWFLAGVLGLVLAFVYIL
ncbi:MAG: NADH-quinone oxidoreductase subunit L [Chitinophagales bacterium]|nr:NADH-quinone oxidoreductase subunit L [Chitinophagales bacterium]